MRNEIKIRFEEPVYSIDEEKGTVGCILNCEICYPEMLEFVGFNDKPLFYTTATAKLRDGDMWDVNIGKKVSLAKAEQKAYDKTRKICFSKIKELADVIDKLMIFCDKSFAVCTHNEDYLKQF